MTMTMTACRRSVFRLVPIVVLCVVLLAPSPVRSTSIMQWIMFGFNFLRTIFYYLIPIKRNQMRAIDDTLSGLKDILKDIMPEVGHLRSLEKPSFGLNGYLCLGEGTARNFQTLTKSGSVKCSWEQSNSVIVEIPYHLEEFQVTFGKFYMHMYGIKKKGSIKMDLGHNTVTLGIEIPNVMNMIGKLYSDEDCLMNITKLEVTRLIGVQVTVHSDGLTGGSMTGHIMTTYFSAHPGFLKKAVRESILGNIHLKLSDKSKAVCIAPALADEIHKLGLDKARVYSPAFDERCGNGAKNKESGEEVEIEKEHHRYSISNIFSRKSKQKKESN